jgi:hypothetical protein
MTATAPACAKSPDHELDTAGSRAGGLVRFLPAAAPGLVLASWIVPLVELRLVRPVDRRNVEAQNLALRERVRQKGKLDRLFVWVVRFYPGLLLISNNRNCRVCAVAALSSFFIAFLRSERLRHELGFLGCTRSASGELGACDSDLRRLELEDSNVRLTYGWTAFKVNVVKAFYTGSSRLLLWRISRATVQDLARRGTLWQLT